MDSRIKRCRKREKERAAERDRRLKETVTRVS